ncbi:MAG: hypothetical protein H6822_04405 [Planctomycetaceae bacterium]|nr:hypothetical protein [Planctomycetales bacterium]MCB9921396.1 hypothetical protein [Planctomycetaceae bacterium]
MESSLHKQLKELYADNGAEVEQKLGRYRIDVVGANELIEIQHGSLAAIRDKVADLTTKHRMLVVKPIVIRKRLVKTKSQGGRIVHRRLSPKQGSVLDLFDELVYFTQVFPHPNLTLETPLVDIEEWRYPGHGRRRYRRKSDHVIDDQKLLKLHEVHRFRTRSDLLRLIPEELPDPFHTGHLAAAMDIPRSKAQQIAYCLRKTSALVDCGKLINARLYRRAA